ncbi:MAG: NAD(P)H-hydrate epimerase, partial [Gillisia sp.]
MKVLSVKQLAEADKITVEKQHITSEILMERAATTVFNHIHSKLKNAEIPIKIFCGIGNNGGDGLVIVRLLLQEGYKVTVYVVNYSHKRSENFLSNYDKIKEITNDWPVLLTKDDDFPELSPNDFVIDAIFGIGLNRSLEDWVSKLVRYINKSDPFVLAVDMPSGLFAEKIPGKHDAVISADITISFQAPKLVFFLPQTSKYVGDLQIVDIGLDREYLDNVHSDIELVKKRDIRKRYKNRDKETHKGDYGHCLIVGGSYGKIGSVGLASTASMHTGAGMVTIFAPECGYEILQTMLPEAMVITDKAEKNLTSIDFDLDPDVICFGMGVGTSEESIEAMEKLLN